jgi:hypothetical protein
MVLIYNEKMESHFDGTIIDIETIGNFNNNFPDSRRYSNIQPVIFGCINNHELSIYCAKGIESIEKLKEKISLMLDNLPRPFHAFNSEFEMGVFFHNLNKIVHIERELNIQKYESKMSVVSLLNISQYDDPFNDDGKLCMEAWLMGQIEKAIAHNRSCLLKERDILLKRGFRRSEELNFVYC